MSSKETDYRAVRFGLGPARPGEDWSADGLAKAMTRLGGDDYYRVKDSVARYIEGERLRALRRNASEAEKLAAKKAYAKFGRDAYRSDVHNRIVWGATTRLPFADRMLAFWSDHFTVNQRKGPVRFLAGPFEAEALLPFIGGRFVDLLKSAEKHPAMLIYLDQVSSVGPNSKHGQRKKSGLNENLAREILELHTVGVHGGYTQADVTEFAKLMTGWTVNRKEGRSEYRPQLAEPGARIVLGRSFAEGGRSAGDYDAVLDMLAAHPATARYLATKLIVHFIGGEPAAASVKALEKAYLKSDGSLPDVYRALLSLPEASAPTGAKARNHRDFLIAAIRAAGLGQDDLENGPEGRPLTVGSMTVLRQAYWDAASPAGWPEEPEEWLSPAGLAGRLQVIPRLLRKSKVANAEDLMSRALGATLTARTEKIVKVASNRLEAMSMVLASPEFNRR